MENKLQEKYIVESSVIERVAFKEGVDVVGGMWGIKDYLIKRKKAYDIQKRIDQENEDFSKGILITGFPGCGKNLIPKLASIIFDLPLIKINVKMLLREEVNELRYNIKVLLKKIEKLEPCILWIDEIDLNDGRGNFEKNIFLELCNWLKDKNDRIIPILILRDIFSTSLNEIKNNVFDEIFFIDLPNNEERIDILKIYLRVLEIDENSLILEKLSLLFQGYSSYEMKKISKILIEELFIQEENFTIEKIVNIIENNKPLSEIFEKKIKKIKESVKELKFRLSSEKLEKNIVIKKIMRKNDLVYSKGGIFKPSFSFEEVEIVNLYVSKFLVTQSLWVDLMKENPSHDKGENLPVERISWWKSLEYCNKLSEAYGFLPVYNLENGNLKINYLSGEIVEPNIADFGKTEGFRLPTEVEWEWIAKGGDKTLGKSLTKYCGSNNLDEVAWHWDNSFRKSHEVGKKAPNELGIYDMSGNIWEWCYDTKTQGEISKEKPYLYDITEGYRRLKGGSWGNYENYCTPSYRYYGGAVGYGSNIGLRVVRTAK